MRHIPVLILTSSRDEKDIARAFMGKADLYIVKPDNLEHFVEIVDSIEKFWAKKRG